MLGNTGLNVGGRNQTPLKDPWNGVAGSQLCCSALPGFLCEGLVAREGSPGRKRGLPEGELGADTSTLSTLMPPESLAD